MCTKLGHESGLILEVVLILRTTIHVYMDLGLNQSGLIFKVVVLYRWLFNEVPLYTIACLIYQTQLDLCNHDKNCTHMHMHTQRVQQEGSSTSAAHALTAIIKVSKHHYAAPKCTTENIVYVAIKAQVALALLNKQLQS